MQSKVDRIIKVLSLHTLEPIDLIYMVIYACYTIKWHKSEIIANNLEIGKLIINLNQGTCKMKFFLISITW